MGNWSDYDQSLVERGSLTIWLAPAAIAHWNARPTQRRRGGQRKYSDLAIETALTLRLLFRLPLRQIEGFMRSLFELMGLPLDVPDPTTLSRRSAGSIELVIDSSGWAVFGEGEWAAAKHGGNGVRGWKKLHLAVDQDGVIVGQKLTDASASDGQVGVELMSRVPGKIRRVIGDGAYDSRALYDVADSRGAKAVVPPIKTAQVGGDDCRARGRVVRRIRTVGRRQWKKEAGYHQQARAENAFFRYKTIFGDRMRARAADAQVVEARLACNILNRMTELATPASCPVRM
ncbi:MAG: IS5 family transposase [Planctomycetota bacterium]